jgi:tetratricopeptide (TPR) repeat protein
MMRPTIKRLSAACAGMLMLACADLGGNGARASRAADDAYAAARRNHLAGRLADAEAGYRAALAAEPTHLSARNGIATLYAGQGDFARAIPIWQALADKVTLASGPGSAFVFNNLGYAYLLNGEYDQAITALQKACLLDPLNHRTWLHLGQALHKLGEDARAKQMFSQANALQDHDLRSDYTAVGGSRLPAIDAAVKAPARPAADEWGARDEVVGSGGILELRRIPAERLVAAPAAAPARQAPPERPAAAAAAAAAASPALLEIRNGNGVAGMAKALSLQMGDPGLKVLRLTNDKGFRVQQTRIEYQGAFRAAAERLAGRLPGAKLVEVDNCKPSDMRLVIGRDFAVGKFSLRPEPARTAPELAVAGKPGKSG